MRIISLFIAVAILSPFIANDRPLVVKYHGNWLFPAFSSKHQLTTSNEETINYNMGNDWKLLETDFSIFPLCAYSPHTLDAENAPLKSPFDNQFLLLKNGETISMPFKYRHWLGTTQNGNDVLSCLIHGTKISLSIGVFSMLIASFFGILLGASAGYFGNISLKIGYIQSVFLIISVFLSWFYGFTTRGEQLLPAFNTGGLALIFELSMSLIICVAIIAVLSWTGRLFDKLFHTEHKVKLPVDAIVSRMIEVLNSIPSLLLIIAISAITKPSYILLIIIIGFLSWTDIARLIRAEYLKSKELNYVLACKAIGMNDYRIMIKHILPNVLPLFFVQFIFGMVAGILAELSLSFIGFGVPIDMVTWGSLLNEAKDHFSSWWLVVFPGLCIFVLIYTYNKIATELSKITKTNSQKN